MGKTVLILKVKSRQGRRDELRALWEEHLRPRAETNAAQELYLYCYDSEDPDTIHMVEVYGDPAAMASNASASWFHEYLRAAGPLIDGRPEMSTCLPLWAKGYAL